MKLPKPVKRKKILDIGHNAKYLSSIRLTPNAEGIKRFGTDTFPIMNRLVLSGTDVYKAAYIMEELREERLAPTRKDGKPFTVSSTNVKHLTEKYLTHPLIAKRNLEAFEAIQADALSPYIAIEEAIRATKTELRTVWNEDGTESKQVFVVVPDHKVRLDAAMRKLALLGLDPRAIQLMQVNIQNNNNGVQQKITVSNIFSTHTITENMTEEQQIDALARIEAMTRNKQIPLLPEPGVIEGEYSEDKPQTGYKETSE